VRGAATTQLAIALVALAAGPGAAAAQPGGEAPPPAAAGAPVALEDDGPVIELYTMGLGEEWVERFGHSAMCVRWPEPRRDRCYNYGTTSFEQPASMVWNFLRGRSTFWVSTSRVEQMIDSYVALDRTLWVQPLPLSPPQARALAAALAEDARPENRYYHYHHYEDNCTTRLRDFIDGATGGALSRGAGGEYPSLRALSRAGWAELPPLLYLSDVLIGRRIDRRPNAFEAMFLPLVLRDQVEAVLGVTPELIYLRQSRPIGTDPPGRLPFLVLFVLLAAPLVVARRTGRFERAALIWAVVPVVLLGALVWGLALVSPVPELRWNELLLVFLPTDLLLVIGPRRWRRPYARARVVGLVLVSLGRAVGLLRQPLWLFVLLPLAAAAFVATRRDPVSAGAAGAEPAAAPAAP
jgi:hypothetical protein